MVQNIAQEFDDLSEELTRLRTTLLDQSMKVQDRINKIRKMVGDDKCRESVRTVAEVNSEVKRIRREIMKTLDRLMELEVDWFL